MSILGLHVGISHVRHDGVPCYSLLHMSVTSLGLSIHGAGSNDQSHESSVAQFKMDLSWTNYNIELGHRIFHGVQLPHKRREHDIYHSNIFYAICMVSISTTLATRCSRS